MTDVTGMAQELAWLIKDNLSGKHVVLSTEQAFVAFLDPEQGLSKGNILMLEPMAAYHRMLLHRLAEIFRLGHESIGDGCDRRLVLERCEDSRIPDVLVSDILDYNEEELNTSALRITPHLLKRTTQSDLVEHAQVQSHPLSFEERQAAYLAARERIFSEGIMNEPILSRPRSVPVVARRMIAHALGKSALPEQNLKVVPDLGRGDSSTCDSLQTEEQTVKSVSLETFESGSQSPPMKNVEILHAKAAKRMFAQALGIELHKSFCSRRQEMRMNERIIEIGSSEAPEESVDEQVPSFQKSSSSKLIRQAKTDKLCTHLSRSSLNEREVLLNQSLQMSSIQNQPSGNRPKERKNDHDERSTESFSTRMSGKVMTSPSPASFPDHVKAGERCRASEVCNVNIMPAHECRQSFAKTADIEQGKAAQRMLAHALGRRTFSSEGTARNRNS